MFAARVDALVFAFNCEPLAYVDRSWLRDGEADALARMRASGDRQARALASHWLLQHFELAGSQDFDFSFAHKRLLLLDAGALNELALFLGLSSLGHLLRTCVLKAQQLALRRCLGEERFDFYAAQVLAWPPVARLVLGKARMERLLNDPQALCRSATRFGAGLLLACDRPDGAARRRARLKYARPLAERSRQRALGEPRRQAVTEFSVGCVIRHRFPQWHWLF